MVGGAHLFQQLKNNAFRDSVTDMLGRSSEEVLELIFMTDLCHQYTILRPVFIKCLTVCLFVVRRLLLVGGCLIRRSEISAICRLLSLINNFVYSNVMR